VYTNISIDGVELLITYINAKKEQKTKKSITGRTLAESDILGLKDSQWRLVLNGYVLGTNVEDLYLKRSTIEGFDDLLPHTYVDGIHDGEYYVVPGSIVFDDTEETSGTGMYFTFSLELVEE